MLSALKNKREVTRKFKMEKVCMESYVTLDKDELISRDMDEL
jgi:hypothetical protein